MKTTKRFFVFIAVGALVGSLAFGWFSPGMIEWYFSPPADLALSCKPAVLWAIETYRKVIILGGIVGALGAVLLFFAFAMRAKPAVQAPPPGGDKPL